MQEIKFTADGKKVVVIGSLNSQEKIVQEIFIINGNEIPSGENFVVKSLHDAPAISWKDAELKKINDRYETEKKKYEVEIEKNYKAYKERASELRAKMSHIGLALKNANEKSFETLVDFITGEIKWVVVNHYDLEILEIDKFTQMYEDKLRLFSLFGNDDGTFTYAVGDYYDFSGGNKKFYPFKTYDEAIAKFKDVVLAKGVSDRTLLLCEKYGFVFPDSEIKEYKSKQVLELEKRIASYNEQIQKWQQSIDSI